MTSGKFCAGGIYINAIECSYSSKINFYPSGVLFGAISNSGYVAIITNAIGKAVGIITAAMNRGLYGRSFLFRDIGRYIPNLIDNMIVLANCQEIETAWLKGQRNFSGRNIYFHIAAIIKIVQVRDLIGQCKLICNFLIVVFIDEHDVVASRYTIFHEGYDNTIAGFGLGIERNISGIARSNTSFAATGVMNLQGIQLR